MDAPDNDIGLFKFPGVCMFFSHLIEIGPELLRNLALLA